MVLSPSSDCVALVWRSVPIETFHVVVWHYFLRFLVEWFYFHILEMIESRGGFSSVLNLATLGVFALLSCHLGALWPLLTSINTFNCITRVMREGATSVLVQSLVGVLVGNRVTLTIGVGGWMAVNVWARSPKFSVRLVFIDPVDKFRQKTVLVIQFWVFKQSFNDFSSILWVAQIGVRVQGTQSFWRLVQSLICFFCLNLLLD